MPSDIRVFVRFKEQCAFAGEELNCVITFKNAAEAVEPPTPGTGSFRHTKRNSISQLAAAQAAAATNARLGPADRLQNVRSPSVGRNERPQGNKHRGSYSLSSPSTPIPRGPSPSDEIDNRAPHHQRSVSIISGQTPILSPPIREPGNGRGQANSKHRRSSTVQLSGMLLKISLISTNHFIDATRRASQNERQLSSDFRLTRPAGRRSPLSASHSPSEAESDLQPEFRFPSDRPGLQADRLQPAPRSEMPRVQHRRDVSVSSRTADHRMSSDVYSQSNHSDETLMSEQPSMISERPAARSRMPSELIRQHYKMAPPPALRRPQAVTLLMGYAQVSASFTLDASLVDQTPFEEVKKKGFLGGQSGGGVVGVKKKARPSSGLFGGFNFASIGESLESIIGGETSSSAKEMKAVANSRAIPLLSAPQSLLFVDAHLEPGDERSFSFNFKLPRGLPPSHRGKAIKILYNLTIGVQGAPGTQSQVADVRQINVPFRVFPGVDSDGEILGHDLMQPHVILKDLAKTSQLDDPRQDYTTKQPTLNDIETSNIKFLEFVDTLLDRNRRRQSSSSIMMEAFKPAGGAYGSTQNQVVKAIDHAIMTSNQVGTSSDSLTSPNRFEIASGGRRIAVVTIDRPLHRLGETVTVVVDFSNSDVVCSSLRATLETCEKVVPGLAVRSAATVSRVTRKIYASRAENVLFVQRAVFTPTVPVLVSPTFITTGVSLDWSVKLEFGTVKDSRSTNDETEQGINDSKSVSVKPPLLEEIVNDERGVVEVAVESLDCDTFEVTIPITVYGDVVQDGTASADDVVGVPI